VDFRLQIADCDFGLRIAGWGRHGAWGIRLDMVAESHEEKCRVCNRHSHSLDGLLKKRTLGSAS
jgi:hypothetical protein